MKSKMKNQNIIGIAMAAAFAFALASVTEAAPCPQWGCGQQRPEISIHTTGNILRGETGSFVLEKNPLLLGGAMYVNFKVSGTAIPGADYVALISPAYIGASGYAVLSVKTLPSPRGSFITQAHSVVVTLERGPGYSLGTSSSATIWITNSCVEACW
jgi:hypothetical protein